MSTPATSITNKTIYQRVGHTPPGERMQSIDALRGFSMFWISGVDFFFHALALTTGWGWAVLLSNQLKHTPWIGFTFYDLIQPLFLFITGITLPLWVGRRLSRGQTRWEVIRRLLFRTAALIILGHMDENGPISLAIAHNRFGGVLQRIGLADLVAGVIIMSTRTRSQILWVIGILVGYWALLTFVPYPGQPAPSFEQGKNITDYIDQHIMPGYLVSGDHDWEALGSAAPTVATVLLGALAGTWILSKRTVGLKLAGLCGGGLAFLALGKLWGMQLPITKQLWTSSYVLYAAGWSCLLLAFFYGLIDGLGWKRWSFPFIIIGMNPLVIYLLWETGWINFPYIAQFFFGWSFNHGGIVMHNAESVVGWIYPPVVVSAHPVGQNLATVGVELLFVYWLYRRKIFWRV